MKVTKSKFLSGLYIPVGLRAEFEAFYKDFASGRYEEPTAEYSHKSGLPVVLIHTKGNGARASLWFIEECFADFGKIGKDFGEAYFYKHLGHGAPQRFATRKHRVLIDTRTEN